MIDDDEKPLTLTREDLYELAWSKPISELAKDFGISDVGLAKRCKRLGIPTPGLRSSSPRRSALDLKSLAMASRPAGLSGQQQARNHSQ